MEDLHREMVMDRRIWRFGDVVIGEVGAQSISSTSPSYASVIPGGSTRARGVVAEVVGDVREVGPRAPMRRDIATASSTEKCVGCGCHRSASSTSVSTPVEQARSTRRECRCSRSDTRTTRSGTRGPATARAGPARARTSRRPRQNGPPAGTGAGPARRRRAARPTQRRTRSSAGGPRACSASA